QARADRPLGDLVQELPDDGQDDARGSGGRGGALELRQDQVPGRSARSDAGQGCDAALRRRRPPDLRYPSPAVRADTLRQELERETDGEVRFDRLSRALYSTDASVYQIEPLGVVVVRNRGDLVRTVEIARRHGCSITARGGGTSQAGQAIGPGLQLDTSKYLNRILEVNTAERWAWVEPGVVLDELNARLRPDMLRFAPDISTASRATMGGMISNNSSGARSVLYGKTINHVLELEVVLADASVARLAGLDPAALAAVCAGDTFLARCCTAVRQVAWSCRDEVDR